MRADIGNALFYMDLTGTWQFFELFENGFDHGYAVLRQNGNEIDGTISYREFIADDVDFLISVDVEGEVQDEETFVLFGKTMEIFAPDIEYNFDDRRGTMLDDNTIEGDSMDEQGQGGHFFMRRMD